MKNIYFCGHTGSDNRGCEAIVRSSVGIFRKAGFQGELNLATFAPAQDEAAGVDKLCKLIPYDQYKSKLQRGVSALKRRFFGKVLAGQDIIQRKLWDSVGKDDLCLSIGGDTYCYGTPTVFMAHNRAMEQKGIPTVLWCCSVEKDRLSGAILEDIRRYDMIVARETITRDALLDAGIDSDRVVLCCDPAFNLAVTRCELPKGFLTGNTLGLNVSGLVSTEATMEAVDYLITKLLSETDMNICLIPHVYTASPHSGDLSLMQDIMAKYRESGRVCIVDKSLNCEQLKYIISQCRFFVGARTHSTIAAYSTSAPTLVLGYSVKSRGIARDIFGSEEGYVLPYNEIKSKEDIYFRFQKIMNSENEIKDLYAEVMPQYKATVYSVAQEIISKY